MKKVLAGIAVVVLLLSLSAATVFAKGMGRGSYSNAGTGVCQNVDNCPYDGNCSGSCTQNEAGQGCGSSAGRGTGQGCGMRSGSGSNR